MFFPHRWIKPWITKGILKSIKLKQKMYRSHFLSHDYEKVTAYKNTPIPYLVLFPRIKKIIFNPNLKDARVT